MNVVQREHPDWPGLTWAAVVRADSRDVDLLHGPLVEARDDWAIEGVWAGPFDEGGFDRTSLVFGSGVRCRGDHVSFVSAGTSIDRLWHVDRGGSRVVSNSLPALLAVSGVRLLDEVPNYPGMLGSLLTTVGRGTVVVPSTVAPIECVYFHNLEWDGRDLREAPKPLDAPSFDAFKVYRDFLVRAARDVGKNAADDARTEPFSLLTTITSGYDSSAASVLAREAGCRRAVTIESARSVVPRSDSGEAIASALGLDCDVYPRGGRDHPRELDFWAATGSVQDANLAVFDYPEPPCLLFSGAAGGRFWTMDVNDLGLGLRTGSNTLGFCEYRLRKGVVHFPVPFCGARRAGELFELSHSAEMSPWVLDGAYDRPTPRRIAEEAGVPREAFGQRKSATQFEESFRWPRRPELQRSYRRYLEARDRSPPPARLGRLAGRLEKYLFFPIRSRIFKRASPYRVWPAASELLFQWANHELAAELEGTGDFRALEEAV